MIHKFIKKGNGPYEHIESFNLGEKEFEIMPYKTFNGCCHYTEIPISIDLDKFKVSLKIPDIKHEWNEEDRIETLYLDDTKLDGLDEHGRQAWSDYRNYKLNNVLNKDRKDNI